MTATFKVRPSASDPELDCQLCPRLAEFRALARIKVPGGHNAPVMNFGDPDARLLIVGLAPGLQGANRTGRPFTGDWAGDLLYETLLEFGFARGQYLQRADDGLTLIDTMITNAVRCVPPDNKPTPAEINQCRQFLNRTASNLPRLRAIVTLGRIAHNSVVRALGRKPAHSSFGHGTFHDIDGIRLFNSYHCSRYNTNTGVLTPEMFRAIFRSVRGFLDGRDQPGPIGHDAAPKTE